MLYPEAAGFLGFSPHCCSLLVMRLQSFPARPEFQKLSYSLRNELYLTSGFFVFFVLSLLTKTFHFFHPSFSLPHSFFPQPYLCIPPLFLIIHSFCFLLLCCPIWSLITPPIGCAPMVLRWLCPLPECHLCPRSASASPLHPPRGPVRSRSSDRQKSSMTTSVSADGALDPSMVWTPLF